MLITSDIPTLTNPSVPSHQWGFQPLLRHFLPASLPSIDLCAKPCYEAGTGVLDFSGAGLTVKSDERITVSLVSRSMPVTSIV